MSSLIVVSNRVSPPEKPGDEPSGGLVARRSAARGECPGRWWRGVGVGEGVGERMRKSGGREGGLQK